MSAPPTERIGGTTDGRRRRPTLWALVGRSSTVAGTSGTVPHGPNGPRRTTAPRSSTEPGVRAAPGAGLPVARSVPLVGRPRTSAAVLVVIVGLAAIVAPGCGSDAQAGFADRCASLSGRDLADDIGYRLEHGVDRAASTAGGAFDPEVLDALGMGLVEDVHLLRPPELADEADRYLAAWESILAGDPPEGEERRAAVDAAAALTDEIARQCAGYEPERGSA